MFTTCAQGLEKKIEGYRAIESTNSDDDPHDLEMKTLLLDALSKKIQQERPITIPTMRNSPPLLDDNPLVLHSSGVLSEKRSITPPSSKHGVPIGAGIGIAQVGMYPSFTQAAQHHQAGLSNVFRLGSFQNSMLFSPSPVAVRQPATVEPFRL